MQYVARVEAVYEVVIEASNEDEAYEKFQAVYEAENFGQDIAPDYWAWEIRGPGGEPIAESK